MTPPYISPALLEKYLQNKCTDSEKDLVETWYASINKQKNFLANITEEEQRRLKTDILLNINSEIQKTETVPLLRKPVWRWLAGVAAAVVLLAGFFLSKNFQKQKTPVAKKVEEKVPEKLIQFTNDQPRIVMHRLPDGSSVWMHKDASIAYPREFDRDKRLITFIGEAFFDITKDKSRPFSIQSGEMAIKVLGTSFNVKALAKKKVFRISVVTGSVEVTATDLQQKKQLVILKPQQQVIFETKSKRLTISTMPVQVKREIFQPVTVVFQDTPLNKVIEQLQKKFNIKIRLSSPAMSSCLVNADFEQQTLPFIMEMLCTALDANYTMSENVISLDGLPCE